MKVMHKNDLVRAKDLWQLEDRLLKLIHDGKENSPEKIIIKHPLPSYIDVINKAKENLLLYTCPRCFHLCVQDCICLNCDFDKTE